ncbi:phage integrase N-terminal SAM-like domain-containing protein [Sphingopyxis sp.]|uniref:phage integrase N-terminal SAM-like domain-containing protein n=1 Tax=Sphingopyxis sp. TaxID=1908224 RepID=UPI0025DC5884|nr:phage integrase N-terminal SAM-like domain-containing protein [Sphingopyxis sp.]
MAMRRFGPETQRNYLRDVGRFATWLQRSPHTATAEDIRQFQFEQLEAGVPAPTMNSIVGALRFFFTHTLDRPDLARKLIRAKQVRKIPVVLTMAEVKRLLDATRCLNTRMHCRLSCWNRWAASCAKNQSSHKALSEASRTRAPSPSKCMKIWFGKVPPWLEMRPFFSRSSSIDT